MVACEAGDLEKGDSFRNGPGAADGADRRMGVEMARLERGCVCADR